MGAPSWGDVLAPPGWDARGPCEGATAAAWGKSMPQDCPCHDSESGAGPLARGLAAEPVTWRSWSALWR